MKRNNKPTFQDKLEEFLYQQDVILIGALILGGIALWVVEELILKE